MHSERQKVDQANSSLLEYKNFFYMGFGTLAPGNEAVRYIGRNYRILYLSLEIIPIFLLIFKTI